MTYAEELSSLLKLNHPPIGVRYTNSPTLPAFAAPMSEPTEDGRFGTVAASCVFWVQDGAFSTAAPDHGNCSVGNYVHGFVEASEIMDKADVGALLDVGWVTEAAFAGVTKTNRPASHIEYAPAASMSDADIVLVQLNAKQMMELSDAVDGLEMSGKPQCQIVPLAREHGQVTVSFGCALSRQRTGMSENDLTCAIPADLLEGIVVRLRDVCRADHAVEGYAVADAARF